MAIQTRDEELLTTGQVAALMGTARRQRRPAPLTREELDALSRPPLDVGSVGTEP